MLESLKRLLTVRGYEVKSFDSASNFVSTYEVEGRGIVVLDIAMPEMDGLAVQRVLAEQDIGMPIIFLSGVEDVEVAVQAMKAGAADFLVKPVSTADLLTAIDRAMELETKAFDKRMHRVFARQLVDTLTPRESEVLVRVIAGNLNKEIAGDLGTSEKTISFIADG
ncbi:MAG: response regulator transcription factor [Hyphomicrobiaceae bacterium]